MAAFDNIGIPTTPPDTGGDGGSETTETPSTDGIPSDEQLVAPIKPAQPILGGNIFENDTLNLDGSCGDDVDDYGNCYKYNFERALSNYGTNEIGAYFNVLNTAYNSARDTTNPDAATVSTRYNDGADVTFTSNAQYSDYTDPGTLRTLQIKRLPSEKEFFKEFINNKFNILEPSINFGLPPEGQSVADDQREENCTRTTANLLYNKIRRSGSVEQQNNLDPALIKPFPTAEYKGTVSTIKMGAWNESVDSTIIERNDGFCFIAKLPNVGSYGSIKIKFRIRIGTSGYTPFVFNNNIANGLDGNIPLQPQDFRSPRSPIYEWTFGSTDAFDKQFWKVSNSAIPVGEDNNRPVGQQEGKVFYPSVYKFNRGMQTVTDGRVPVGRTHEMYDGSSPELVLHSSHLANAHTGLTSAASSDGHVDHGSINNGIMNFSVNYTKIYNIKKPLLKELNYANLDSYHRLALGVAYNTNTDLGKRLADPHHYNRNIGQFVREGNCLGYTFAPIGSNLNFIDYSNGLHSRISHLFLNRSSYRPFHQWPNNMNSNNRLFPNEQVLVTYRSMYQRSINWNTNLTSFTVGNYFDKTMSGYSATGKYDDGRTQYYRNHLGYQNGSKLDYPRADVMRADLTQKHYEIIVYKGILDYNINTGEETYSAEDFGGASEGFVEYFRFRTHDQSSEGREISNYNINESSELDSFAQFGGATENVPNGQSEEAFTKRDYTNGSVGQGNNSIGAPTGFEVNYPNTNTNEIAISPDGDSFIINFSENFIHENKQELGHIRVAVIQDVIELADSKVSTFSDDSRSNGGTGISVDPVYSETLSIVTHDEIGLGNDQPRELGGTFDSRSLYLPVAGQGGFIDGQAEVDEHLVNLFAIKNGISVQAASSQISQYIGEPARYNSGSDRGAPVSDYDYKAHRLANQPFPVIGGYINLFTTANWLALKMLWARYGSGQLGSDGDSWPNWYYAVNPNESQNLGDRALMNYYYYEPWKIEIEYTTKGSITHLDTNIGPRCSSNRTQFQTTPSTSLANMPFQCGECLNRIIPEEEYEEGEVFNALTEGFPEEDQEDDNRSYIRIKDND